MNQLFKNDCKELNAKHEKMLNDDFQRKINFAEKEITIFINAIKGLEEMGEDRISTDFMKNALLSVRRELRR